MTIVLNGTTGITNDGGYTGDGVVFADTTPANTLVTTTGGNVGVGTSSPSAAKLVVRSGTGTAHTVLGNDYGSLYLETASGGPNRITSLNSALNAGQALAFNGAGGAEWGRFDSSGNLLVGTTTSQNAVYRVQAENSSTAGQYTARSTTAASGKFWHFGASANAFIIYNQADVGQYMVDGATSWTANSDERLKTALMPFENAAAKVATLRAGTGRYLTDEESVSRSFLIAQDVQKVLPEAVDVQPDEQGTLGLRYQDMIPLLTAAIQEQQAIITALTARVAALEGTTNV